MILITVKTKTMPVKDGGRKTPIIGSNIVQPTPSTQTITDSNKSSANRCWAKSHLAAARRRRLQTGRHSLQTATRIPQKILLRQALISLCPYLAQGLQTATR